MKIITKKEFFLVLLDQVSYQFRNNKIDDLDVLISAYEDLKGRDFDEVQVTTEGKNLTFTISESIKE